MGQSEARISYLEALLREAGYWETRYGWHNGTQFIGLNMRPSVPPIGAEPELTPRGRNES